MSYYFPLILMVLVCITGFVYLLDVIFFAPRRKRLAKSGGFASVGMPWWIDYSRSFFPVLFIVLIIRSFIVQPYRVPTGSLEPTVLPGDFLAVNQFAYGLRTPMSHHTIIPVGKPKRGDIVVFPYPRNNKIDFVKRVVGVPGDHIEYKDKKLYINGTLAEQTFIGPGVDVESNRNVAVDEYEENLMGVKHRILIQPIGGDNGEYDFVVPPKQYLMMGDNRDNSGDSREWGFAPEENLIGKAFLIWMSWDGQRHRVRWDRIGTVLK